MNIRFGLKSCALVLGATMTMSAMAQNAPPDPAKQAINYRKALFTVLASNYTPLGAVVAGRAEYKADDVAKRAERVAFISSMVGDAFPEVSKDGDTKAKPEAWTDAAGFANAVKALTDSTSALATLVKTDKTNSAAFKAAQAKVGESCKGCHDNYRAK